MIKTAIYIVGLRDNRSGKVSYLKEIMMTYGIFSMTRDIFEAQKYTSETLAEKAAKNLQKAYDENMGLNNYTATVTRRDETISEDCFEQLGYEQLLDTVIKIESSGFYNRDLVVLKEALTKLFAPIKPFAESKQSYLCPKCSAGINFDALNDAFDNAPKFCAKCGQKFDWSDISEGY